jgi:hypothetical protein
MRDSIRTSKSVAAATQIPVSPSQTDRSSVAPSNAFWITAFPDACRMTTDLLSGGRNDTQQHGESEAEPDVQAEARHRRSRPGSFLTQSERPN